VKPGILEKIEKILEEEGIAEENKAKTAQRILLEVMMDILNKATDKQKAKGGE